MFGVVKKGGRVVGLILAGMSISIIIIQLFSIAFAQSTITVAETSDFATLVLADPWDMSEFGDVSRYINRSGQADLLQNIQTLNGIFSAQSTSSSDAQFFPLHTGYETAMLLGKVGENYPIQTADYSCLHVAMKVDSGPASLGGPSQDVFVLFWFGDERLNLGPWWGFSRPFLLYPEAPIAQPTHYWRLYSMDLSDPSNHGGEDQWTSHTPWKGLRIDPTNDPNINFQVDWVRLTDCAPSNVSLNWTPQAGTYEVWVHSSETGNNIKLTASSIPGMDGSYSLDTQGLAPGTYTVMLGSVTTCCSGPSPTPNTIIVNQTPIVQFESPSPFSGDDYATLAGNPWDMDSSADVTSTECTSGSFAGGLLSLDTPTGSAQPPSCETAGISDPKLQLNAPVQADTSEYRYLTYRMRTVDPWQNVPDGMIIRWIWSIQHTNGFPDSRCHLVSQDIPFDIGWQIESIDLHHVFNGSVEEHSTGCPPEPLTWLNTSPVLDMRFDPNENILGYTLHQEIDWIRLTKVDAVTRGNAYVVEIDLSKQTSLVNLEFFYTDDPTNNPTKFPALQYFHSGAFKLYLPQITLHTDGSPLNTTSFTYLWDTSGVPLGSYYICATADDGLNQGTYCSLAPVKVE